MSVANAGFQFDPKSVFFAIVDVLWVFGISGRANAIANEQVAVHPQKTMTHAHFGRFRVDMATTPLISPAAPRQFHAAGTYF